jgi:Uma2 family endonuclease
MSALRHEAMSEAEYLAMERASEIKHEYLDGYAYAMAGASDAHNIICAYTLISLGSQLRGGPCTIRPSDMRVKIAATGLYTYPDISVVCGESQFVAGEFDTLLNPVLIVEVLSPSTEMFDRGKKFHHYRQLESLREYILIAQDSPHIERFLRQDDNTWLFTDVTGMDASLELPSIGCTLALAEVYEKVAFGTDDPPQI